MKIVINKCYGGFSLSPLAVKRFAELEGKKCYFFINAKKKNGGIDFEKLLPATLEEVEKNSWHWHAFTTSKPPSSAEWDKLSMTERQKINEKYDKINLSCRPEDRSNPNLVKAVEELGDEANGDCAKLRIVEIPDGIEWEISEYDGMESVEEKHRSWG